MNLLLNLPEHITFTGVDARTDLDRCAQIASDYPVEFGVLIGGNPSKNRYPGGRVIEPFSHTGIRKSLHTCKDVALDVNAGIFTNYMRLFDRVQVNLMDHQYNYERLSRVAVREDTKVIIQIRKGFIVPGLPGIDQLCDRSGGRGVRGTDWPDAPDGMHVGYAGGISPENVMDVIAEISAESYSIDMESSVRDTDDWFDLDKCEAVCRAVYGAPALTQDLNSSYAR